MIAIFTIGVVPMLWSAILAATARRQAPLEPVDRWRLALMIVPGVLGVSLALLEPWLPRPSWVAPPSVDLWPVLTGLPSMAPAPVQAQPSASWLQWAAPGLLAVYLLGLARAAVRLLISQVRLHRIVAHSEPPDPAAAEIEVHITERATPPFVGPGSTVVLPRHLVDRLSKPQLDLIVAHERAHIARGDPLYFLTLAWVDVIHWYNPFVRRQTQRCRLAAEIAIDRLITARAPGLRRAYARALVEALKTAVIPAHAAAPTAAFGQNYREQEMRLTEILKPTRNSDLRSASRRLGLLTTMLVPVLAAQWSYAIAEDRKVEFTTVPLHGKITSEFGEVPSRRNGRTRNHHGIDIAAARNTPIVAPGPGRVVKVQENYKRYGHLLTIDHGGGIITRYAHLSRFEVKKGQRLQAGDIIARVGNTGVSSGPHLHLEVLKDGEHVNPRSFVPLP